MTEAVSKRKILVARVAVALIIAFVVMGVTWYGLS
jgi:hypothetical protein